MYSFLRAINTNIHVTGPLLALQCVADTQCIHIVRYLVLLVDQKLVSCR